MRKIGVVIFISFLLPYFSKPYYAQAETIYDGNVIYHETFSGNVSENIIEDVLPLLADDLLDMLLPHVDNLIKSAKYYTPENIWLYKIVKREDFKNLLKSIDKSNVESVSTVFAKSLKIIIDISMSSDSFDPNNDIFRGNLNYFLINYNNLYSEVNYVGYFGMSLDEAVNGIYNLRSYRKDKVYPFLIIATANLWNSVWDNGEKKINANNISYVRRHPVVNFGNRVAAKEYSSYADCFKAEQENILQKVKVSSGPGAIFALNQSRIQAAMICGPQYNKSVKITPVNNNTHQLQDINDKLDKIERKLW